MTLSEAIKGIRPLDQDCMRETKRRLDSIIKPLDSLGKLESHLIKISGMTGKTRFDFSKKAVVVFCADNGVVAQGVTQSPQEVTAIVTENLTTGDTCVCAMAKIAGAAVVPVDIGVAVDLHISGLRQCKVAYGTKDFTVEHAMSPEQAVQALEVGIALARELKAEGYALAATGEMGIGNTTSSAAIASVLTGLDATCATGRGAGLSSEGLERKITAVRHALELHKPDPHNPVDILSKVGGFDIAGMAGFCLGAATAGLPVVLDGVISCVAAALACLIAPDVRGYLLPSHISAEPAGKLMLELLGFHPPLDADMRLGEGTGAVATFPLYDMIAAVYAQMVDFSDENMQPYEHYV